MHKGNTDKLNKSALNTYARVINNFDIRKRFISTQSVDSQNPLEDEDPNVQSSQISRKVEKSAAYQKSSAENSINR